MSARHSADHDAVLERIVSGELDADSPAGLALARCAVCHGRLTRLVPLTASLDRAGELERAVLAEAAEMRGAPGEERVAAVLADLRAARASERAPTRPRPLLVLLAAAAALTVALTWWGVSRPSPVPPGPPGREFLGSEEEASMSPRGEVESYSPFHWDIELPAGGWFVVYVYDEDLAELGHSDRLEIGEWVPSADEAASWPVRIYWQVTVYGADGTPGATFEVPASLRSR